MRAAIIVPLFFFLCHCATVQHDENTSGDLRPLHTTQFSSFRPKNSTYSIYHPTRFYDTDYNARYKTAKAWWVVQ